MNLMYFVENFYNRLPRFRYILMKLIFGDKTCSITLFDREITINTLRENGYFRAFRMSQKSSLLRDEVSVLLNLSMLLKEGDSFIDVGANVGIFSSMLARYRLFLPHFNIYAFEANPDTYLRLQENSYRHGFQSYNIGISDDDCELEFVDGAVSHVFTTIENASQYHIKNKTVKIKCKRLDEFEFLGNSIILKIDVEGQELKVLKGANSLFQQKRIKAVYLDGFSDQEEVIEFFKFYNFSFLEGRNLTETDGKVFSLLAISKDKLPGKNC